MKRPHILLFALWLLAASSGAETCFETTPETVCEVAEASAKLQLKQGAIEGFRTEAGDGRKFYSFKTIPYAQPPVGELRLADPVPAHGWVGVRNGSVPTPKCPQISMAAFFEGEMAIEGEEDCLYLNVYTPRPYPSDLPVMVWIHGGGFTLGDAEAYPPLPLLTKDVVLVIIQYRLATLGFFSTEDSTIPGNFGLKDQTLALRWVKDNIRDLGGDPDKVTIFGESAGGASVHAHILSPMSKGLFHRAIMQSGTMLCPWARAEGHREVALKVAELISCSEAVPSPSVLDSKKLLACLREASYETLIAVQNDLVIWHWSPQFMLPRVDGEFFPEAPEVLLRKGDYNKVDLLTGITQHEGGTFAQMLLVDGNKTAKITDDFEVAGPLFLSFRGHEDNDDYLARRIFHHYMGRIEALEEKSDEFEQLVTYRIIKHGHLEALDHHASDAAHGFKVFAYELQHRARTTFADLFFPPDEKFAKWVGHGDDLLYMFDSLMGVSASNNSADVFLSHIIVDLWTNFAATGHPTPDLSLGFRWAPTSGTDSGSYLSLVPAPLMKKFQESEALEFWRNLPTKSNKLLYPHRFRKHYGSATEQCHTGA